MLTGASQLGTWLAAPYISTGRAKGHGQGPHPLSAWGARCQSHEQSPGQVEMKVFKPAQATSDELLDLDFERGEGGRRKIRQHGKETRVLAREGGVKGSR